MSIKKSKFTKRRNRTELVLESPEFQVYRVKSGHDGIKERPTKILMNDLIDEESMMNLRKAISYLDSEKEDEVVLIAKVKARRITCNYLKFIIEKNTHSIINGNRLNVICEWVN